jgi:cellulose biosynthesis protein BcsQ
MNPHDWFNFLKELLQKDAEVVAAFVIGMLFVTFVVIALRRWAFPVATQRRVTELTNELSAATARVKELEKDLQLEMGRLSSFDDIRKEHDRVMAQLRAEGAALQQALTQITEEREKQKQARKLAEREKKELTGNLKDEQSRYNAAASQFQAQLEAEHARHSAAVGQLQAQLETEQAKVRELDAQHRQTIKTANQRIITLNKNFETVQLQLLAQREKMQGLSQECEKLKEECNNIATANREMRPQLEEARAKFQEVTHLAGGYKLQLAALTQQVRQIDELQGKFWERPVGADIPPFRPFAKGCPPVLAVANLKGGVGKTSLVANLAATFAAQGKRVLAVDMDYQGSLTQICIPWETFQDLQRGGDRLVQDVLKARSEHAAIAWRNAVTVQNGANGGKGSLRLLATDEHLADVEEHLKARWLLNPDSADLRYVLRGALHDKRIQDEFDVILIDCPPRLSSACINAFAACDHVLVAVIPDRTSAEAVPRLFAWLQHLRSKKICPDLSVLGLVVNRTYQSTQLTAKETAVCEEMRAKCKLSWNAPVCQFDRFIPSSQVLVDAAAKGEFAAFHPKLQSLFVDLAKEVQRRVNAHEGSRAATVH